MNPQDKLNVITRYSERIRRYGIDPKALGWRNKDQQNLRFKVMVEGIRNKKNLRILDLGCGFGDLNAYLKSILNKFEYEGWDLSPDIISVAKKINASGAFKVKDIDCESAEEGSYDYIFMSGLFNYKIDDNESFYKTMIYKAFSLCTKGIIFNLMSNKVDFEDSTLHYYDVGKVANFCSSLSRNYTIRHDYPLFEFTIYLYKEI